MEQVYGMNAQAVEREFLQGDFHHLASCPMVFGTYEDIHGTVGAAILKKNKVEHPLIRVFAHNSGLMLELGLQGIGACFCPSIIVERTLTEQEQSRLLVFHLGPKASYRIRFGYKDGSYQWSIIKRFIECAKEYMGGKIAKREKRTGSAGQSG